MRPTSEMILSRKNAVYIVCAMLGPLALYVYRSISAGDGTLSTGYMGIILQSIPRVEGVLLPRSLMELTEIEEVRGLHYYSCIAFLDATISFLFLVTMVSTLFEAYYHPVDNFQHPTTIESLPLKRVVISFFIALIALLVGPAEFTQVSLYLNYVDPYGFYFIKTALIITIGYYHLNKLLIEGFFSLFRVNRVFIPR